ncbi:MAG: hypothetical protein AB1Z20_13865 [Desulfobacterales bacterium]
MNFGHCDLLVISYLLFDIWNLSPKLKGFFSDQKGGLRPEAPLNLEPFSFLGLYGGHRSFFFTCGGVILYAERKAYEDRNGGALRPPLTGCWQ